MIRKFSIEVDPSTDDGGFDEDALQMAINAKKAYAALWDMQHVNEHDLKLLVQSVAGEYTLSLAETNELVNRAELLQIIFRRLAYNKIEDNGVNMEFYR